MKNFRANDLPTDEREREELLRRLMDRVFVTEKCWNWTGYKSRFGYGYIRRGGAVDRRRRLVVHRVAYELMRGNSIPSGMTLDHLCRNQLCVNPDHLEPVTPEENLRRKPKPTHCKNGHPFAGKNLRIRFDGARLCRECDKIKAQRHREKRKCEQR